MLSTLLKKQFLEISQIYFKDPKTGQRRSTVGVVAYVLLFAFVFFSVAMLFVGMGTGLAAAFVPLGLSWLAYALPALMSLLVGTLLSLLFCYNSVFKARDNDLLLALPIPPRYILAARLVGVAALCLFCSLITWLPAAICVNIFAAELGAGISAAGIVFSLLTTLLITLFGICLTCLVGWAISAIASRAKNRSMVTTLAAFILLIAYFVAYFGIMNNADAIMAAIAGKANAISVVFWPFYQIGLACTGKFLPFAIVTLLGLILIALCFFLMDKTFIKLATSQGSSRVKQKYEGNEVREVTPKAALLFRELKHFFSVPAYIINSGFGVVMLLLLAVLAWIKADALRDAELMIGTIMPAAQSMFPALLGLGICMVVGTCCLTAPSISLEGKELWIIRSLPVKAADVLEAKLKMQYQIVGGPAALCAAAIAGAFGFDFGTCLMLAILAFVYCFLNACLGLALNLKMPNFIWTDPAVPVKQGAPIMLLFMGGFVLCAALAFLGIALAPVMDGFIYLCVLACVLNVIVILMRRWLASKGAAIFDQLY